MYHMYVKAVEIKESKEHLVGKFHLGPSVLPSKKTISSLTCKETESVRRSGLP